MTIIESVEALIGFMKEISQDEPFTITIQNNSPDPYRPPSGVGWKKAMSLEAAIMNAVKEVLIKIGHGAGNAYFYK
nr:hypothetical protein [Candidatus Sigynarchaeota archaeon]